MSKVKNIDDHRQENKPEESKFKQESTDVLKTAVQQIVFDNLKLTLLFDKFQDNQAIRAKLMHGYYKVLCENGFTEEQAFQILIKDK